MKNDVGYGKPPVGSRFVKGQSGNPAGRPRGRHRSAPYEPVLGQMITIREGGKQRRVSATEAYLLQLAKRGLEGDGAAARASLQLIERARESSDTREPMTIVRSFIDPGSVTSALETLRMAKKLDPYRETARMALEPWLVEAAIERIAHPLSRSDQRIVLDATRTPKKVRWPAWWTELP